MKKYFISGIGISNSGVGYLLQRLIPLAKENNFQILCPKHKKTSLSDIKNPLLKTYELYKRKIDKYIFEKELKKIKNAEIILLHPQTIGYQNFITLIEKNSYIKFYVMDNSFFCMKSYNTLHGQECLECLGNCNKVNMACQPFPIQISKIDNLSFLKKLSEISSKIVFYTQNKNQSLLIKSHFGNNIVIRQIGLQTGEIFENDYIKNTAKQYDVVYHAACVEAKGFNYFLELADSLPQYSFFIPCDKQKIDKNIKIPLNVVFMNKVWNNGLKEIVINSRLVLCPSIWSAPIEGALLKSIHYNGNVGVVDLQYNFGSEIPDNVVLKLSSDIKQASASIKHFLEKKIDFSIESRKWLSEFYSLECNLLDLFIDNPQINRSEKNKSDV